MLSSVNCAYSRLISSSKTGGLGDADRVGARGGRRVGGGDASRVLAGVAGGAAVAGRGRGWSGSGGRSGYMRSNRRISSWSNWRRNVRLAESRHRNEAERTPTIGNVRAIDG